MAGPFGILLTPWVIDELVQGNIQILIGVAVVVGIRRPAAWAFVLLTKVTPAVGLVYFIGRRDWRSLGVALGATALVSAVSFVIAPHLWWDWFALLSANSGATHDGTMPGPLPVRLAVAAAIAFVAGRREWPWLVPFACAISLPVAWWGGLVITGGAVRLWRDRGASGGSEGIRADVDLGAHGIGPRPTSCGPADPLRAGTRPCYGSSDGSGGCCARWIASSIDASVTGGHRPWRERIRRAVTRRSRPPGEARPVTAPGPG